MIHQLQHSSFPPTRFRITPLSRREQSGHTYCSSHLTQLQRVVFQASSIRAYSSKVAGRTYGRPPGTSASSPCANFFAYHLRLVFRMPSFGNGAAWLAGSCPIYQVCKDSLDPSARNRLLRHGDIISRRFPPHVPILP